MACIPKLDFYQVPDPIIGDPGDVVRTHPVLGFRLLSTVHH
jgi:hypothetical protein